MYFVSYSRRDSELVLRLVKDLRRAGADLWLDQLDITGGQRWDEAIEEALRACAGMVAVLSPNALDSDNFKDEVAFGLDERKTIVPVVAQDCEVPYRLRRLQQVDFSESYDSGFDDLLRALDLEAPRVEATPADRVASHLPTDPTPRDPVVEPSGALPPRDEVRKKEETVAVPENSVFPARWAVSEGAGRQAEPRGEVPEPSATWRKGAVVLVVLALPVWLVWRYATESDHRSSLEDGLVLLDSRCVPTEWADERGIEWISVCAGTFTMGAPADEPGTDADERPQRRVTLPAFSMMKYEVTQEQYKELDPDHQSKWRYEGRETAQWPVTDVDWQQSNSFCQSAGGRLPTEAEWEYVARAGTTTPWSFGAEESLLKDYAVYGSGWDRDFKFKGTPASVGTKKPNPWGFYDLHGNVEEWVQDWYGPYPATAEDAPTGPEKGRARVLRGGSFALLPGDLRSAYRDKDGPGLAGWGVGFRCARPDMF